MAPAFAVGKHKEVLLKVWDGSFADLMDGLQTALEPANIGVLLSNRRVGMDALSVYFQLKFIG